MSRAARGSGKCLLVANFRVSVAMVTADDLLKSLPCQNCAVKFLHNKTTAELTPPVLRVSQEADEAVTERLN